MDGLRVSHAASLSVDNSRPQSKTPSASRMETLLIPEQTASRPANQRATREWQSQILRDRPILDPLRTAELSGDPPDFTPTRLQDQNRTVDSRPPSSALSVFEPSHLSPGVLRSEVWYSCIRGRVVLLPSSTQLRYQRRQGIDADVDAPSLRQAYSQDAMATADEGADTLGLAREAHGRCGLRSRQGETEPGEHVRKCVAVGFCPSLHICVRLVEVSKRDSEKAARSNGYAIARTMYINCKAVLGWTHVRGGSISQKVNPTIANTSRQRCHEQTVGRTARRDFVHFAGPNSCKPACIISLAPLAARRDAHQVVGKVTRRVANAAGSIHRSRVLRSALHH